MTEHAMLQQLVKQLDRIEMQCQDNARLLGKLETRLEAYDAKTQAVEVRLAVVEKYIAQQQGKQQANRTLLTFATGLSGVGGAGGLFALLKALM